PRIAAGMHRFGQNQTVEFCVVFGLTDYNSRLVRHAAGSHSGNEVLIRLIIEFRVRVLRRDQGLLGVVVVIHEGFEKLSGTRHRNSSRYGGGDLFYGSSRRLCATSTAAAASSGRCALCAIRGWILSRDGNRQLRANRRHSSRCCQDNQNNLSW